MANFFHRFAEWQNYLHYALLAVALTIFYYSIIWAIYGVQVSILQDFIVLFVILLVADSVIHFVFWVAPKPIQWRD